MRRVVFAFIAGFLATITFHQIALALLHAAHVAPHAAWSMQPVPPVAPLKHQPIPHSVKMAILGFTVNAAWGLGTALFYRLFSRK